MKIDYIEANRHPGDKTRLTIVVDVPTPFIAELIGNARHKPYEVILQPIKNKRSLEANAYYQVLLDKLASSLATSRDEVHEQMLLRYGATKCKKDGKPIVFPTLPNEDGHEITRYCEVIKEGVINNKPCLWWRVVKGSSEMNTEEFSHVIDGVISELKEMGVAIPERTINEADS